jgi:GNAT superfamily N-acetyltransferase
MRARQLDLLNARDRRIFSELPFHIYRPYPLWVPNLASELSLVMNRQKHPFYRHSEADFLVVESESQAVGRLAVLHNQKYSAHHGTPTAFFYYFECIDDPAAARLLFDAAIDWARQRQVERVLGPKGFLRSSGIGLLVEGFQYPPAVGIPYNPPYYPALIEAAGFEKETDHLSGYLYKNQSIPARVLQIAEKVKQRDNFWIKSFTSKREMRAWIDRVEQVHQEAFHRNPGYYPSTPEEFALIARNMIQVADPRLVKLIMHGEEVAGFMIAYADITPALRTSRGRLFPFGWLRILLEMRLAKLVNLNGIGLLPKYQGLGSNALLYAELEKTLRASGFEQAEIVQVDERNFKSRSDMETVGVEWVKRHRTYRLQIETNGRDDDIQPADLD